MSIMSMTWSELPSENDCINTLTKMIEQDCLPEVGTWIWLEENKLRLYVYEDCVEFMTPKETLQIELQETA